MASIQQSLNQMLGSVAGIATAGSYLYTQSDAYKAGQRERQARHYETLANEAMDRYLAVEETDRDAAIYEEARSLEEQAYLTSPTSERARRYIEIKGERTEEEEAASEERRKREEAASEEQRMREKAERNAMERYAVRARILGLTESQLRAREEILQNKGGNT